jgi:hypothetical protein
MGMDCRVPPVELCMHITQRQSLLGFLIFLLLGTFLALVLQLITGAPLTEVAATVLGALIFGGVLIAYWRGWEYARHCVVIALTLLTVSSLQEPFLSERFSLAVTLPPVIALAFTAWVAAGAERASPTATAASTAPTPPRLGLVQQGTS